MCFSAQADLVVGTVVIAIGVDALRHVREPKQIPLAAVPVLLGTHQVVEAFVWWGLHGEVTHHLERVALWSYLLFAFSVLPLLVPVAVGLVEPVRVRRMVIGVLAGCSTVVVVALTAALFRGPIGAMIQGHHIAYQVPALRFGGPLTIVYVLAACGALLASSHRDLARLGAVSLVVTPVLAWFNQSGFVSLWCFWAALVSIFIAHHLRRASQHPTPGKLSPVAQGQPH